MVVRQFLPVLVTGVRLSTERTRPDLEKRRKYKWTSRLFYTSLPLSLYVIASIIGIFIITADSHLWVRLLYYITLRFNVSCLGTPIINILNSVIDISRNGGRYMENVGKYRRVLVVRTTSD